MSLPRLFTLVGIVPTLLGASPAQAAGDPVRGQRAFQKCYSCHSVDPTESNLPGPNLHRVLGRRAGTLPGFEFSPALVKAGREAGIVWTEESLDRFLSDAEAYVPGINMAFPGLRDAGERADVIAYIKHASQ